MRALGSYRSKSVCFRLLRGLCPLYVVPLLILNYAVFTTTMYFFSMSVCHSTISRMRDLSERQLGWQKSSNTQKKAYLGAYIQVPRVHHTSEKESRSSCTTYCASGNTSCTTTFKALHGQMNTRILLTYQNTVLLQVLLESLFIKKGVALRSALS